MKYQWKIDKISIQTSILNFISAHIKEACSKRQIKNTIEHGALRLNGKVETFSSYKLKPGDLIQFNYLQEIKKRLVIIPEMVLYEDSYLLAINKPPGFTSTPTDSKFPDLESSIKKHFKLSYLKMIHRLDKDTSGVLLAAKNEETFNLYVQYFREKRINKKYIAYVHGIPENERGTISSSLGLIKKTEYTEKWGNVNPDKGKSAVTLYRLLKSYRSVSLLELTPLTGRTHQIRVHLASLGLPIVGDLLYGNKEENEFSTQVTRHLLHSISIIVPHPENKDSAIEIEAPWPEDFIQFRKFLQKN